jgi:hypothetical protein
MRAPPRKVSTNVLAWLLVGLGLVLASALLQRTDPLGAPVELAYSRFVNLVEQGEVNTAVFRGEQVSGTFVRPIEVMGGRTYARYSTRIPSLEGAALLKLLGERKVEVSAEAPAVGVG